MSYIKVGSKFPELKDKVVLITGGSSGIGLTTAELFIRNGAKVVIADLRPPPSELAGVDFVETDVTVWSSITSMFARAFETFGRIDIVFANAGINEREDIFLDQYDAEGNLKEPSYQVLDVNLKSVLSTTKLATHYFAKNSPAGGKLIITGSFAAYFGEPIPVYTATKHGVLGLVRSIRNSAPKFNVTVNVVCPWIVNTHWLSPALEATLQTHGVPITDVSNVARGVAHIAMSDWNGKSLYVAADKFIELESGIDSTRKDWLGAEFDELASRNKLYADKLQMPSGW